MGPCLPIEQQRLPTVRLEVVDDVASPQQQQAALSSLQ